MSRVIRRLARWLPTCLALAFLILAESPAPVAAQASSACTFVLGFATLHDLIPNVVGACVDNEQHNPANGDALQQTANGLLVWRKADNFTAFTDGYHSWVNGPAGVQERLNTQRFPWEANPQGLPVAGAAVVSGTDWPTYHHDGSRDGVATAGPNPSSAHRLWQSPALDGQIYAEPLVTGGQVFVATENDSVYALDSATGNVVWSAHLGTPVAGSSLPCGDINPVGITSTPVIDTTTGVLYAAGMVQPGRDILFALNLVTGAVLWQRGIDPPGADPAIQGQRGALALANGMVYVPFGGRDYDCGAYHGIVVGVTTSGTGSLLTYQTPTAAGGAVWAPGGIATDAGGSLYAATGNGGSTSFDYSDSVLRLSSTLTLQDYFAPADWATLSRDDLDLGSIAPTLLDNGLIFQAGKAGVGYLLRTGGLGQIAGAAFQGQVCAGGGAYSAAAYAAPELFVSCSSGLTALNVNSGTPSFTVLWRDGVDIGAPIVAGATVWGVGRNGVLYALDPSDGAVVQQIAVGASATSFPSLSAANGRLFVPAGTAVVAVGS